MNSGDDQGKMGGVKVDEVPQDLGTLEELKEIAYARDDAGQWVMVPTVGWEAKIIANETARERMDQLAAEALARFRSGESSPLDYYMTRYELTVGDFAKYVGLAKWRVKRHMKPATFNTLKPKILEKYADFFSISVDELITCTG